MTTLAKTYISHKHWKTKVFLEALIVCQTTRYSFARHLRWHPKGKNCPEIESWLELLEWSHFLIMSKNDSMSPIVGYVISYDCCCHHRMDANELLTYMHGCHLFRVRI
jgi:hypothetical protein